MLLLLRSALFLNIAIAFVHAFEWCQDYATKRCDEWKARGLCKSTSRHVQTIMKRMCYESCHYCKPPPAEICYNDRHEVSKYGCCWDGIIAAAGPHGQGCPVCENSKSRQFCLTWKDLCFTESNWEFLRVNCPETCGYCRKPPHPCYDESGAETTCGNDCYDVEPQKRCERRKWCGYCSIEEWKDYMSKNCARTCGICGIDECRDVTLTRVCTAWKKKGRCENAGSTWTNFMKKKCRLTCGFCGKDKKEKVTRQL